MHMLASRIKKTLKANGVSIGTWMSMAHVSIAEILASAGYDWVVIDMEHGAIDVSEVLPLIIAIERGGAIPLVRLTWNDPKQAKVVLDSGAAGLLVPMVNSKAEAELAVEYSKYPPMGARGTGLARAHGYGPNFKQYIQDANRDSLLIIQIEHIDAVESIDDILSVKGIDGVFIGPYDLSMSMELPGELTHPKVEAAKQRVLEAAVAHGLAPGIHLVHPDAIKKELKPCMESGYRFIALGTDILFLGDSCRQIQVEARRLLEGKS
jgi:2-dehydro-3-deoxyglucarate aldolase